MAVGPTGDEYRGPRSQGVAAWETKRLAAHFADEHPAGHVLWCVAQIDDGNDLCFQVYGLKYYLRQRRSYCWCRRGGQRSR